MDEKRKLEFTALKYFINEYNINNKKSFLNPNSIKSGEKPDFTVMDMRDYEIGIEISHLYYDEEEAKMLLRRSNRTLHKAMSSDAEINRINRLIEKKIGELKNYRKHFRYILVIRVTSPIFDETTFKTQKNSIKIPENNFSEIWLLFRDSSGGWKNIMKLK